VKISRFHEGKALRRLMVLLSLLAALAGTPLREVEAANDLVGTIAELGGDSVIEMTDGGVGDDSDATIRAKPTQVPAMNLFFVDLLLSPGPMAASPSRSLPCRVDGSPSRTWSLARRLALLQCFLC
jgi:hypothetical protein